jgi:hypothetical protein
MRNPRCDRDHYFSCWREGVIACPLVGIIITIAISTAVVNIILTIEDSISIVIVTVVAHV